jgi:hypothetical protein
MSEEESPQHKDQPSKEGPGAGADSPVGNENEDRTSDELGRKFSAWAAQPGRSRERLGTERDAISGFTGYAAARDMTINYTVASDAKDAVKQARLQQAALDEARDVFVEPDGFSELAAELRRSRLLFLSADSGHGKYMAARRLLMDCPAVYRLDPATKLGAVSGAALTKGCGYILGDLPGPAARELSSYDLTTLATVLGADQADAWLVVTVPSGRRFKDPEVAAAVRPLGEVTDRMAVWLRHLERRLGADDTEQVADDSELMALIAEELGKNSSPSYAALLAEFTAEAVEQGEPLTDTVRGRISVRDETAFVEWADGLPDLPTQSMALAVAALGGAPYETVSALADILKRGLEPEKPLQSAEPTRTAPLVPRKNARLNTLQAHVVPSKVRTRHGGAPAGVVRFRDPSLQERYLLRFWNEYDDARPELLGWLRLCARHELESIRVRAAVATGMLTAKAFDHVRAHVIEPWAADEERQLRDAAAMALRSAVTKEPALRAPVRDLVRSWSMEGSPELRATAARSWRIEYDVAGPEAALAALEQLSESEDREVIEAVCDSITEMWEAEGEQLEAPARLLRWLKKNTSKETARLAFLFAAADLVRHVKGAEWPSLLYLAGINPDRHREIAALWHDVLNAPRLNSFAKEILAEWAYTADTHRLLCRYLGRLMASAATDRRSFLIIDREAEDWVKGPRAAPNAAAAVRSALRNGSALHPDSAPHVVRRTSKDRELS